VYSGRYGCRLVVEVLPSGAGLRIMASSDGGSKLKKRHVASGAWKSIRQAQGRLPQTGNEPVKRTYSSDAEASRVARRQPKDWNSDEEGAYVDLHEVQGKVERVDQQHVKYFLDLRPGEKQQVRYNVTYKRRKQGPELNAEKKREPL
jgi:hypothetical protein